MHTDKMENLINKFCIEILKQNLFWNEFFSLQWQLNWNGGNKNCLQDTAFFSTYKKKW